MFNLRFFDIISFTFFFLSCIIIFSLAKIWLVSKRRIQKRKDDNSRVIGFFHPFCNAGGGGERVLWTAIRLLQKTYDNVHCIVYTGDVTASQQDIIEKVKNQFNITFERDVEFVYLQRRSLVEARHYPFFTLLFQSLASVILGIEALWKYVPDIYIDTMGYAFTLPLFKYVGTCQTACYVHYPTISTDMLDTVTQREVAVNNRPFISNSRVLSFLKSWYYKAFAFLYGIVGRSADVVMVNSTWTKGHIVELWQTISKTVVVYPPCNTSEFENLPIERTNEQKQMISIAQFRPEKNHDLQLQSLQALLIQLPLKQHDEVKLVLVGGCRDDEDFKRVEKLKRLSRYLGIHQHVEFKVNLPFNELLQEMANSSIALHTMPNEHFGIGIVECMSAGLLVIAHCSGGPKCDILVSTSDDEGCGLLASTVEQYAERMKVLLNFPERDLIPLRLSARISARRFSEQNFERSFLEATKTLFS